MKSDRKIVVLNEFSKHIVTQSDVTDASKIALRTTQQGTQQGAIGFVYLTRRETLQLIANLVRLLLANLRE